MSRLVVRWAPTEAPKLPLESADGDDAESGRARLREIRIGEGDDRFRVVSEGVQEGDVVILFPGDTVRDGDLVETAK